MNPTSEPAVAADLCGRDVATAHAWLGAPLACTFHDHEVWLGYHDGDGTLRADAVVFVDGVVVRAAARLRANSRAAWGGQFVERVLPAFGRLLALLPARAGLQLVFASSCVFVHDGRVVHVAPRPRQHGIWLLPGSPAVTAAG